MIHPRTFSPILLALVVQLSAGSLSHADNKEKLFVATPLTTENAFTPGIEGPACDAHGNVYAVNFARQQTIGRIAPNGKSEVFVELPGKSTGNGIVFDRKGRMYVADYVEHKVLRIDPATRKISAEVESLLRAYCCVATSTRAFLAFARGCGSIGRTFGPLWRWREWSRRTMPRSERCVRR